METQKLLIMKHKQINYKKKKSDNREEKVLQLGYRMLKDGTLLNLKNKSIGYGKKNDYKKIQVKLFDKKLNKKITKDIFLHRIQAFKKFGYKLYNIGTEVRHMDHDKQNNSYQNIEIGTAKDNYQDNGIEFINSQQRKATLASIKYSKEKIKEAKDYFKKSNNLTKTAKKFNMPVTTLRYRIYGYK